MTVPLSGQQNFMDRFGQEIVDGVLTPGTVLRTEELQERYEATRSVAREGIKGLQALGLVAVTRNVGVRIRRPGHWNVFDPRVLHWRLNGPQRASQLLLITEFRLGVEPIAARLAAQRISASGGQQLMECAGDLLAAGNAGRQKAFLEADIAFHRMILRASQNEMFAHLHEAVGEVLSGRTEHHLQPQHPHSSALHWHLGVADAIQRGDAGQAEEQMRKIVLQANEEMRADLGLLGDD
ncbi:FadR/GntR family transcriptional regulator [Psychromicrobium xiongbiense]|uniref:FadR/GntR family transcriptional regulator n=1 Tax=Psychromicrobium xiongbiense TaxID=3051184 RepID=UPI002555FBF1|nr:FCD domain-containing protein [Psychromicrobium sp. YIM S02556]